MSPQFALMTHTNCGASNGARQKSQCRLLARRGSPTGLEGTTAAGRLSDVQAADFRY